MTPPVGAVPAERPSTPLGPRAVGRRPVLAALLVLGFAVAAVIVGWLLSERTASRDAALPPEIERLVDDYVAALNDWDREAYLSLVTGDATHRTPSASRTAAVHARHVEDFRVIDLHIGPIGEPIVYGDGPWYVAQAVRITATTYSEERGGIMVLTIVDDDGAPRIARHIYSGSRGPA